MIARLIRLIRADVWQNALTAILAIVLVQACISAARDGAWLQLLLLAVSAVAICLRVRAPEASLGVQLLVTVLIASLADHALILHWGLATASLLSLASLRGRTTVIAAGGSVLAVLYATAAIVDADGWQAALRSTSNLALVAWTLASAGVGTAVRVQRQYIRAVEEQALRAEQGRENEAQRRVAEERLRIARELHDAVAHQMAVVSMFTGLARTTLTSAPEQAEQALVQAQTATRTVLSELQQILRILREPGASADGGEDAGHGDPRTTALDAPVHGMDDIEALVQSFEQLGMRIRVVTPGEQRSVSTAVGLTAYRVVQEALTNAHKYGTGAVEVRIDRHLHDLIIDVSNPIDRGHHQGAASRTIASTGFGLLGMRERVRMLGGTLTHAVNDQTFRVTAVLPLNAEARMNERA